MLELPPLSLYVHIPWCVRKCPYCDFNSHERKGPLPEAAYVDALLQDLDIELEQAQGRKLTSIFIGGGTPSLFSAESFDRLLNAVRSTPGLEEDAEITLEANPGTVEAARFRDFRAVGINRLSLGIQSFNDQQLQNLGRIHDARQAADAITIARQAGFDNLNIDLMHGLSGQDREAAMADLRTGLGFEPQHLSWYQLTIEPNTVFYRHRPELPDEISIDSIQEAGQKLLAQHGYGQYEVSAYARGQRLSAHNMNYWEFGDYLGIGAGAHGKLTFPAHDSIVRTRKKKQPEHYLRSSVDRLARREEIARQDRPLEFLLNALRLRRGFSPALFESRTGLAFEQIAKRVEYLQSRQLLDASDEVVRTTDRGYQLLNTVLGEFT